MKKKFIMIFIATTFALTLTSCGLKDAITGQNTEQDTVDNIDISDESTDDNVDSEDNITNNPLKDVTKDVSNDFISDDSESANSSNISNPSSKEETASSSNTVKRDCRIFYFNSAELKPYYVDGTVAVTDNAFVTALTSKLYASPDDDLMVIPKDFGVSSATLDYDTNILKVVFNEDFTKTMTLGTATESGLISAIVNTYGYNYGVEKVAIYFGDTLYSGLKGELAEGYFTVSFGDAIEYKK